MLKVPKNAQPDGSEGSMGLAGHSEQIPRHYYLETSANSDNLDQAPALFVIFFFI